MLTLTVNGKEYQLEVDSETPLLWVLREQLGLTGTKYGCGIAECGNCMVLIDGEPDLSCTIEVGDLEGAEVTTIEGLSGKVAQKVKEAWLAEDVPQCGYCQSGQIMAATALLTENANPSEEEVNEAMSGVLCRCGTYGSIRRAIDSAGRAINND